MTRPAKDRTRRKLRDAVVAEAVEKGVGAVNVAGVVARARVSAGTVYVHFESKEDMLRSVYMDIKSEFHAFVTRARDEPDAALMVRRMWFDMFEFVRTRPLEFLFLEFGGAARILAPEQQAVADGFAEDIAALLRRGVETGALAPLDTRLLTLLLVAPATQLARRAALAGEDIPEDMIERTFERVWLSISNP